MSNETPLSPEAEKLAAARKRNLDLALSQIQKDFGENAIMRLGDNVKMEVDVIPTGNLLIDRALGVGGFARGRIVEIYGPALLVEEVIILGGVRSMKGEKQMIYKNITFKADPFSYNLEFDDRITLVGGNSGTGKTVLYEMLEDLRLTNEYKAIKLFNYKSDNFSESIEQCRDNFIVVDNADNLINDEVRRFINFEPSNQYMLFLRNCDGLNVSDKSFKVLKFDNNRITLEEEL